MAHDSQDEKPSRSEAVVDAVARELHRRDPRVPASTDEAENSRVEDLALLKQWQEDLGGKNPETVHGSHTVAATILICSGPGNAPND